MYYVKGWSNGKNPEEGHQWGYAVLTSSPDIEVPETSDIKGDVVTYEVDNKNVIGMDINRIDNVGETSEQIQALLEQGVWPIICVSEQKDAYIVNNVKNSTHSATVVYNKLTLDPNVFPDGVSSLLAVFEV